MPQLNGRDNLGRTTQQINNSWRGTTQRPSVTGQGENISPAEAAARRQVGIRGGNQILNETGNRRGNSFDFSSMYGGSPTNPAGSPTSPGGGYGSYGGGGGGCGLTDAGMKQIMQLLGRKPQQYGYNPLAIDDYQGTGFRDWDGSMYDMARGGVTEGLAADAAAGAAAYGDARTELDQYRNPFAGREYATNQGMPDAMQRMLKANNATLDPTETARGSEADAAFGNVLALLGGTADQAQASAQRALGGDERRFNESLASQRRTMNVGVNMTEAKARQQYEQDKWQYGEDIARANYEKNSQVAMANNTGQNQTDQANVGLINDNNAQSTQALIQLLSSGQKIDPAQLTAFMGG